MAVLACFKDKWARNDIAGVCEKYGGVRRREIVQSLADHDWGARLDAAESIACELEQRVEDYLASGDYNVLDIDPPAVKRRHDKTTGKIRDIAHLCVWHQLYGHLVARGLDPLFDAKFIPTQYASIPGKGSTALVSDARKMMRSQSLNVRYAVKTDFRSAYASVKYDRVTELLQKMIPEADWIIGLMHALARASPSGSLIIGGYIDALLFNLVLSDILRHTLELRKTRRGKSTRLVSRIISQMDDLAFCGSRLADVKSAVRYAGEYARDNYGMHIVVKNEIKFLSAREEIARKGAAKPSGRACPSLDISGYRISHTHVTLRRTTFLRIRGAVIKAQHSIAESGTMPLSTAQKIISYAGRLECADSHNFDTKYDFGKIKKLATGAVAYNAKKECKNAKHNGF